MCVVWVRMVLYKAKHVKSNTKKYVIMEMSQ